MQKNNTKIISLLIFAFLILTSVTQLHAQVPTVQDCLGAIPVCGSIYHEENAYLQTGNYPNEINSGSSCLKSGEKNCVWYIFTVQQTGTLDFSIMPNNMDDDYDWAVYNLTNHTCEDIYNTPSIEMSCNYAPDPGVTGANGMSGAQNEQTFQVVAGQTYVMNVSQFTNSSQAGYTLDLGASTAVFFDDVKPTIRDVGQIEYCDSTKLTCNFSEPIVCPTVSNIDFEITGPGEPFTVTGVTSENCGVGASYDSKYVLTINPPLQTGTYTLTVTPHVNGSVTDNCGNTAEISSVTFNTTNGYTLNTSTVKPTCHDYTDGIIDASLPGAPGTVRYSLDGTNFFANDGLFTNLPAGTYTIYAQTENLCSAFKSVTIANPNEGFSNAGTDKTLCTSAGFPQLQGSNPGTGIGLWTTNSTTTIMFPNFYQTPLQNVPVGISTFTWTVNHGVCGVFTDEVIITKYNTTTTAGPDDAVCGNSYTLTANDPFPGTGLWTTTTAGVTFDTPTDFNVDLTNLPPGNITFTWTAQYGTCGTFSDNVIIAASANPLTANAADDDRICNINTYDILADVPAQGTGIWTSSQPAVTFANANSTQTLASNIPEGETIFYWTVSEGLCVAQDSIVLTNGTAILANASEDTDICQSDTYTLNGSEPGNEIGLWTTPTAGITFSDQTLFNSEAQNLVFGPNIFTWTLTELDCSSYDEVTITRHEAVTANANGDYFTCSDSVLLQADAPTKGSGYWECDQSFVSIKDPSSAQTWVKNLQHGANTLRWTVLNGACSDTDEITVTRELPVQATVSDDISVCNTSSFMLTGNLASPGTGVWTSSDASVIFSQTTAYNAIVSNIPFGETTFTWSITNGHCTTDSAFTFTRYERINAVTVADEHTCDSIFTIEAIQPAAGTGIWTCVDTDINIAQPSAFSTSAHYLKDAQNVFTWTVTNGTCSHSDNLYIYRDYLAESRAGENSNICDENFNLTANEPYTGTGTWTIVNGGTLNDVTLNSAEISALPLGTHDFVWTIVNGTCTSDDTISVTHDELILANADIDTHICEQNFTLNANNPSQGSGIWTSADANLIFDINSLNTAQVFNLAEGENILTWTITNGGCTNSDGISVTRDVFIAANAGANERLCNTVQSTVTANVPTSGNGQWSSVSNTIVFTTVSSATTTAQALDFGTNDLIWTITNGTCEHSDTVSVIIDRPTLAQAGTDFRACEISDVQLSATQPTIGNGLWKSASASIVFEDETLESTSASNFGYGISELIWTVTNGTCTDSDTIEIINDKKPTPNAGSDVELCDVSELNISGNFEDAESGLWTASDGNVIFDNNSSEIATVSNLTEGETVLRWTLKNGTCTDFDELTIQRYTTQTAEAGTDELVCDHATFNLNATNPAKGTGFWNVISAGAQVSNTANAQSSAQNLQRGLNKFVWTVTNGTCSDSDTLTLDLEFLPVIELGADVDICQGETHKFKVSPNYENYLWNDNSTDSTLTANTSGEYAVSVENKCGLVSDKVNLAVHALPEINAGNDTTVCAEQAVTLSATGEGTIVWNENITQNTEFTPETSGTYTATATTVFGCKNQDSVNVFVNPLPVVETESTLSGTLTVIAQSDAAPLLYAWNDSAYSEIFSYEELEEGMYYIKIKDQNNCVKAIEIYLEVEVPVVIPTIFTPNGDGVNDTWEIESLKQFDTGTIFIFDRFGKELVRYGIHEPGWNGEYMGEPVKPDTYWFVIETLYRSFNGNITIKRQN